jgi:site-specific DNA-methyltransferase (adenine-specific)
VTSIIIRSDSIRAMRTIRDQSIDCIIADIPYGSTQCAWDSVIPLTAMWQQIGRIVKDNTPIVLFAGQPFTSRLIMSKIHWYRTNWVWDKIRGTGFQVARYRPMRSHEDIIVFSRARCNYYPILVPKKNVIARTSERVITASGSNPLKYDDGRDLIYTHSQPKSVLKIGPVANGGKDKFHPTQKPIALLEYLVKTYSLEGDVVLDFTCGSGTTGIACKMHNRNFIGIDNDEEYCRIAEMRISRTEPIIDAVQ